MKPKAVKYFTVFVLGGLAYAGLELIWRSYTHWTMAVTGGVCAALLYYVSRHCKSISLISRALIGCAFITLAELAVGLAVNRYFDWQVWDYSHIPFNFMGQICLAYSSLWFLLCIPVLYFLPRIEKRIPGKGTRKEKRAG